jgi:hypothetical protein
MKEAKAGRAVRTAQTTHIVAWRGAGAAEGGPAAMLEQKRRARGLALRRIRAQLLEAPRACHFHQTRDAFLGGRMR